MRHTTGERIAAYPGAEEKLQVQEEKLQVQEEQLQFKKEVAANDIRSNQQHTVEKLTRASVLIMTWRRSHGCRRSSCSLRQLNCRTMRRWASY